jgi:hypothetical protein
LTCTVVAGIGRIIFVDNVSQMQIVIELSLIFLLTLGITALVTPVTREWIVMQISNRKIKNYRSI